MMRNILFTGLFLIFTHHAFSQVTQFDETFAYRVKQIDEFIERFNDTDETLIKKYIKDQYQADITREELVMSLFDLSRKNWDQALVIKFLEDVVHASRPPYLSFYDSDWYALVVCEGLYHGKNVEFDLTLAVNYHKERNAASWMVKGLHASFLNVPGEVQSGVMLNPSSHGTDFIELIHIFTTPEKYMASTPQVSHPASLSYLLEEVQRKNFEFKHVTNITYHFLQLNNWIFKVQDFPQRQNNAGWLISELLPADIHDKEKYCLEVLHLTP